MQNKVAQYLLAAMAADAAFVARDQGYDYDLLASFGQTAASADRLSNLCGVEGICTTQTIRKIRNFLNRDLFGSGEWYRNVLKDMLSGKKIELNEVELSRKAGFDKEFRQLYETEPPTLEE